MPDSRFFKKRGTFTVSEIAKKFGCEVIGNKDLLIKDIATLYSADEGDISFLNNSKYVAEFKRTKASACIVGEKDIPIAPENITLLVTDNPYDLYANIAALFYADEQYNTGVSEQAVISSKAKIGKNVNIDSFVVIEDGAVIEDGCHISAHVYVGKNVEIGKNTRIHPGAYLEYCIIGSNNIIHSGVRIGQDGFGFAVGKDGINKVLQLGRVIIGNNVEIGANTCIDKGAIEDTIVGDNTKIDNLVQIGHNAVIGKNCFIVAQVGIAGSAKIGDGVMIGGQAGVAGHLSVGKGAKIAAKCGVIQDVEEGLVVGGFPAMNIKDWHRQSIMLKKMVKSSGGKND